MTFIRRVEDFTCEHCGALVSGNGYTNHCPHCLYSKHVDVSPGDRAESCHGLMQPIVLEGATPAYTILQRCVRCGIKRRIKAAPQDDPAALLGIAGKHPGVY